MAVKTAVAVPELPNDATGCTQEEAEDANRATVVVASLRFSDRRGVGGRKAEDIVDSVLELSILVLLCESTTGEFRQWGEENRDRRCERIDFKEALLLIPLTAVSTYLRECQRKVSTNEPMGRENFTSQDTEKPRRRSFERSRLWRGDSQRINNWLPLECLLLVVVMWNNDGRYGIVMGRKQRYDGLKEAAFIVACSNAKDRTNRRESRSCQ